MDIFKYVNSKDIREHLKSINYKFNTLEAIWLIYQCRYLNFEEKCNAWKQVMKEMPDMAFDKKSLPEKFPSVFNTLKEYIEYKIGCIETFKKNENDCYYNFTIRNNDICEESEFNVPIKDYESIFRYIEKEKKYMCLYKDEIGKIDWENPYPVQEYNLTKWKIGRENVYGYMTINDKFEVVSVNIEKSLNDYENKHIDHLMFQFFDEMWFNFPLPFHKGDIVVDPWYKKSESCNCGPFVLEQTCQDLYKNSEGTDSSDMIAYGAFICDDGCTYCECMHEYMNLEYYRDEIKGYQRTLIPMSNFLKGKLEITECLKAYHYILIDELHKKDRNSMYYTNEGLELMGLKELINGK